jgi:phosphate acetyltransferase
MPDDQIPADSAPRHVKYERLVEAARKLPPTKTAIAHPCDEVSLESAVEAAKLGLISPILVGPPGRIQGVAARCNLDGSCSNPG